MPQKGREVVTELGRGTIVDTNVLRETVVVDFGTYQAEVPLAGLKVEPRESEKKRPSTKRRR
jgi:hypothetical protein